MSQHRLGEREPAAQQLQKARELAKERAWLDDEEVSALIQEAEQLLASGSP